MRFIVYRLPGGQVEVIQPIIAVNDPPGFTEADAEARAMASHVPANAIGARFVTATELPTDRSERHKWRIRNGNVEVSTST